MQIYVVEKADKNIRLGLKDASTTIVEPLIQALDNDVDVEFARYIEDHPDLTDPVIEVQVKKGTPEEAIKRAAGTVEQYFSAIE